MSRLTFAVALALTTQMIFSQWSAASDLCGNRNPCRDSDLAPAIQKATTINDPTAAVDAAYMAAIEADSKGCPDAELKPAIGKKPDFIEEASQKIDETYKRMVADDGVCTIEDPCADQELKPAIGKKQTFIEISLENIDKAYKRAVANDVMPRPDGKSVRTMRGTRTNAEAFKK